ncbi:MAG TPA: hypothetical protein PKD12_00795 [Nitrospira sp.]|nr:hypothetical protein [Nitrospira sp.]
MNEMIQWSLWYGMLATLPLAVTRLLITHALERAAARQRSSFVRQRLGGRHGILQNR